MIELFQIHLTLKAAYELRSKGKDEARKEDSEFHNIYFGYSNTLSTRVRVSVR